jgi:hypothetical protein
MPGTMFDAVVDATDAFFDTYLRGDRGSERRLTEFDVPGTQLDWVGEEGSDTTIPTVPRPEGERMASASPADGLTNGQLVTVTWSGFNRNGTINIVQCSGPGGEGAATCDLNNAYILQPDPTGEGSAMIDIVVGPVGTGVCDAANPCVLAVNDSALQDEDATINIPITFAG